MKNGPRTPSPRSTKTRILFICHGNICRSPMAEFIMKDLVKKAEKAFKKPLNKAMKALKNKAVDAKKEAANKADEAVTRSTEKAAQAMGDAAAPVTFGVSAAAGKGAAVMQEAGLQARKAGRELAAKAEKGMTDSVADKIAQYSKSSGIALISGDLPGIGVKETVR